MVLRGGLPLPAKNLPPAVRRLLLPSPRERRPVAPRAAERRASLCLGVVLRAAPLPRQLQEASLPLGQVVNEPRHPEVLQCSKPVGLAAPLPHPPQEASLTLGEVHNQCRRLEVPRASSKRAVGLAPTVPILAQQPLSLGALRRRRQAPPRLALAPRVQSRLALCRLATRVLRRFSRPAGTTGMMRTT